MESIASTENGGITSWASLNLNEIQTERSTEAQERTELPAGSYKMKFVGAKQNPFESGTTDLDFVVVEGPQTKRHLFSRLPSPDKGSWVSAAAALLVKRLGGSQLPGEDLITLLNRIAPTASAITADVIEDTYFSTKNNANVTKPKLQYFSIAAA
jgi:hypothetical protein